ncbi:hypothetical protein [Arthrobacter sp. HMWF013]|uniref:hypothetical protein n=1 Tax=Arthrobacter sp. HMWF013 TaxID=2056849 RepID=UPI000D349961|nr:hypothetical protein [Arthrobacter sp. HMWF013]PTT70302.1 hypothetical protein DBR22_01580 [Arthrobacter sp. HMWF013]
MLDSPAASAECHNYLYKTTHAKVIGMQPDLGQHEANQHADRARELLSAAENELAERPSETELKVAFAQAHATLALALETRAAAYDTRTAAYVSYLAALSTGGHESKQHAVIVEKLVRRRLGFERS